MTTFVKIPSGDVIRYVNKQYMTEADRAAYEKSREKETLAESSLKMVNKLLTP